MVNLYILINIERVSKHTSRTTCGKTCWSWDWTNRTSPSKRVGLGSPLAACSMYGDLTCSVHTVNNIHCFVITKCMYVFVSENHMLDWQWCQICYPLEIKTCLKDNIAPFPGIKICWGPRQWAFYSNITSSQIFIQSLCSTCSTTLA